MIVIIEQDKKLVIAAERAIVTIPLRIKTHHSDTALVNAKDMRGSEAREPFSTGRMLQVCVEV